MASKFAAFIDSLPRLPQEIRNDEKGFWERVQKAKTKTPLKKRQSTKLAATYVKLRRERDSLKEKVKNNNVELTAIEELLEEAFKAEGSKGCSLVSGETVKWIPEPYVVVEDREKVRAWVEADPDLSVKLQADRAKLLPAWSTLNMIVKNLLLQKQAEPEGLKAYFRPKFSITGLKAKSSPQDEEE